jgi:hypothetical protein
VIDAKKAAARNHFKYCIQSRPEERNEITESAGLPEAENGRRSPQRPDSLLPGIGGCPKAWQGAFRTPYFSLMKFIIFGFGKPRWKRGG